MNSHFAALAEKESAMAESADPLERRPATATHGNGSGHEKTPSTIKAWFKSLFGLKTEASLKDAIEEVIEEHEATEEEPLQQQEKEMLRGVLAIGDMAVGDIMIPRTDIVAIPTDIDLETLKAHIIEQRHTRIPVYKDTLDHVEGFLHIKDMFAIIAGDQPYDLASVIRPMLFVPPSMPIIDLLVKMRRLGSHMAIVVDEYGGTDGLVTLEDLFEEIVGDIQDEHDEEEEKTLELVKISSGIYDADARVTIELLQQQLGLDLLIGIDKEDQEFETLGGLIFFHLGRVPSKGERISHESGVMIEVLDAVPRCIKKVRLYNVPEPQGV